MALLSLDLLVILSCAAVGLLIWARTRRHNRPPHPPGPPGLPIVGNLLDIPSPNAFPWDTYMEYGKAYDSDIIRLNALGMNIVVANSIQVATELLDRRSAIYSDRPRMVMLGELSGFGTGLAFVPYNHFWKECRKLARQEFHANPVKKYRPTEAKSAHRFLLDLQRRPESLMDNLRHLAGATIMSIGYDIEVQPEDDPYVQTAEEAVASIAETTNAGSYLVDVIPILKYVPEWFPGAGFKKQARIWHAAVDKLFNDPYTVCQERIAIGQLGECAAKGMIEAFGKHPDDPEYTNTVIKSTLGSLYVGGADTTVSALGTFFLAMTLNHEIVEKAQRQLDQVVGTHRLPDFRDQASLPYIEAIVRETLRWRPVVPLDVPHRLTEDDIYNGYYLPKGSLIVANAWAILHDEKMYPDPERYNPDRFLLPDGTLNPAVRDPSTVAFGFGRRICPGRYMAVDSMWVTIACVLSLFDIRKAVDEDGKEITPDGEYIRGFLCHPKSFPCSIKPRSKEHEQLLNELAQHDL
ncbi:cytochrome P450 [Trametes coccinea BRFM310]|uniref:Cytochrome P450 n=1 Tax=Trametes coccinea (strain BRFM310) TaxID=1353009 RepID=A0A1Y2IQ47_TRAC3|nr:cytochrome P450 [Trametes coccinea BRFM310]